MDFIRTNNFGLMNDAFAITVVTLSGGTSCVFTILCPL